MTDPGTFAAVAVALYAAHHVGDYWVQTHDQAMHKGDAGTEGVHHCLQHVLTYLMTQMGCVVLVTLVLGVRLSVLGYVLGLAVSGVTHYLADRREHGVMFKLARLLPGKARFLTLGVPRRFEVQPFGSAGIMPLDNPSLGTGAWALDQAWHIFWGVFVAAMLMTAV